MKKTTKDGAGLIAEERARQIKKERYTAKHDAGHDCQELSRAAEAYLHNVNGRARFPVGNYPPPGLWPWSWADWNPTVSDVRQLVKAGALIAAEIDRLLKSKNGTPAPSFP